MLQSKQTLKQEIISTLDFLSPESLNLLAKFVSFLRSSPAQEEFHQEEFSTPETEVSITEPSRVVKITSPRLVNRAQVVDFRKEIVAHESI